MADCIWFYCEICDEEYELIEDYDGECPVCGHYNLEPI